MFVSETPEDCFPGPPSTKSGILFTKEDIEKLTGLDFGDLKKHDKMGVVETTANGLPRPIRRSEDISF